LATIDKRKEWLTMGSRSFRLWVSYNLHKLCATNSI